MHYSAALLVCLIGILICSGTVTAAEPQPEQSAGTSNDLPTGNAHPVTPELIAIVRPFIAAQLATEVCSTYGKLTGHCPQDWAELRRSGFVQHDLYAADGTVIDPDDGRLDSAYDLVYTGGLYAGTGQITWNHPGANGPTQEQTKCTWRESYQAELEMLARGGPYTLKGDPDFLALSRDEAMLRQLATAKILNACLSCYTAITPGGGTLTGFCASEFDLLRIGDISPASGLPLKLDGSAGDFKLLVEKDGSPSRFIPVQGDGQPVLFESSTLY